MAIHDNELPKVVAADHVESGVLVYFSDGTSSLFRGDFLYRNRLTDGNGPTDEDPTFSDEVAEST
jgi:hypothetical protein